jgi:hypothetical protein
MVEVPSFARWSDGNHVVFSGGYRCIQVAKDSVLGRLQLPSGGRLEACVDYQKSVTRRMHCAASAPVLAGRKLSAWQLFALAQH